MNAFPFDTLHVQERLIEKGFTPDQARVLIDVASESARDVLATKADLTLEIARLQTRLILGMLAVTGVANTLLFFALRATT